MPFWSRVNQVSWTLVQGTLCGLGALLGTTVQATSPQEELTFESRLREIGDVAGDPGRKVLKALGLPTTQPYPSEVRLARSLEGTKSVSLLVAMEEAWSPWHWQHLRSQGPGKS